MCVVKHSFGFQSPFTVKIRSHKNWRNVSNSQSKQNGWMSLSFFAESTTLIFPPFAVEASRSNFSKGAIHTHEGKIIWCRCKRAELCVVLARPVYQTSLNSSSTVEPNQAFNKPSLELRFVFQPYIWWSRHLFLGPFCLNRAYKLTKHHRITKFRVTEANTITTSFFESLCT